MNIFQAIILSLVEGITEFLPISSTGHLILASRLLGISQTEFVKSFEIAIQLGAICAVIILYSGTLVKKFNIWKRVIFAFIPTGILGFIFYRAVKHFLLGNLNVVIFSLFFGGVFMLVLENYFAKKKRSNSIEELSTGKAFVVGAVQSISMIPGVSRAAATIFGGLGVGLDRESAVAFSFLLAVPTMLAATGLDLIKSGFAFSPNDFALLAVGFIGAFASAMATIKYLINFVKSHSFRVFAYYRIILAALFWFTLR